MTYDNARLDYTFQREHIFLGTTDQRARVLVSGHLYRQPVSRDQETITHEIASNPENLCVSVVAFTGRKNISRNLAAGLHSIEYFGPKIIAPAPGYTLAGVQELVSLAGRWHNNTMRPGCAHMNEPEGETVSDRLDAGVTCHITDQKWGSRWYAEPLPDEVRDRFIELMEKGRTEETDY